MKSDKSGCGSVWLERCVRDAEAGGSNPLTPTISFLNPLFQLLTLIFPACFVFSSGPRTGPQPRKMCFMAAEIPNLVKRNGIYYFRCRIPSILTNGRAREVKISLKTGNLTSDLLDVILKVTDCSRRVIAEAVKSHNQGGATDMNIVTEIRNRITQYINTSLIDQEVYDCEYGATCNASKAEGRKMMLNVCNSVENALKNKDIPQWATATADDILKDMNIPEQYRNFASQEFLKGFLYYAK